MTDAQPTQPVHVDFEATAEDDTLIRDIADRFLDLVGFSNMAGLRLDLRMDLTAVHLNHMALDLDALLNASDLAFIHDVRGIQTHIDRNTGKLTRRSNGHIAGEDAGIFVPRFTLKTENA